MDIAGFTLRNSSVTKRTDEKIVFLSFFKKRKLVGLDVSFSYIAKGRR